MIASLNNVQPTLSGDSTAIVGGGIGGLYAAYQAALEGKKNIHIYESGARAGGKAENVSLGGKTVNFGPEFVDNDQESLKRLCADLGLRLIPCKDQETETFQRPDGKVMSSEQFFAQYAPIVRELNKLRNEIANDPTGRLADSIDQMSVSQLLSKVAAKAEVVENRSWWQKIVDFFMWRTNRVDPMIVQMAATAYTSEAGLPNASGLHFLRETSTTTDQFLVSSCDNRIEGGTGALIDALKKRLEEKGVTFHYNHKLLATAKDGENLGLTFNTPEGPQHVATNRAILALPAYALAKVEGLEALGLSQEGREVLQNTTYTNWTKFTVKLKPGMQVPMMNLFTKDGCQSWIPEQGMVTFLCDGTKLKNGQIKPSAFVKERLANYARAIGSTPEALFDREAGIAFNNPMEVACAGTHGVGNISRMKIFPAEMERLAANGVGLAGSWVPSKGANGLPSIGFMEDSALSGETAWNMVRGHERSRQQMMETSIEQNLSPMPTTHAARLARESANNNKGMGII